MNHEDNMGPTDKTHRLRDASCKRADTNAEHAEFRNKAACAMHSQSFIDRVRT